MLVPEGFDAHPDAQVSADAFHEDHFNADFAGFRTEPPDPNLEPDYSERFHLSGYNRIQQEEAYKFYQQWICARTFHAYPDRRDQPCQPCTTTIPMR